MDPADGSIYAMGGKPDFDPNDFSKVKITRFFESICGKCA